jgi:hypothetical protein
MKLLGLILHLLKTKHMLLLNVLDVVSVIDPLENANVSLVTLVKDAAVPLAQMIAPDMELVNTFLNSAMILVMTSNGLETCQPRINLTSNFLCCGMLTKLVRVFVILSGPILIALVVCVQRVTMLFTQTLIQLQKFKL